MSAEQNHATSSLNDSQQRSLRISCEHMDKLLKDVEDTLNPARSNSVFQRYIQDVTPIQRKTIEDYLARIRAQLLRVLAGQAIEVEKPRITASHSIHTVLTFVEIAIEELSPGRMQGYGDVSEMGSADLNGVMQELQSIVQQLHSYVLQRSAPELGERIKRLSGKEEVDSLRKIEEIVTRRGLVEFRATLLMLLDRMEDTAFEIAIFGRVSSGKSSLLNRVIGADILPVGVTPITAVPTRVSYGREPGMKVWLEGVGVQNADISRISEFVDERLNCDNQKRVSRLAVRFPSDRLLEGIVLVDTPGLGSLATGGAEETMAYLPRCDVAVLLIDAASTLTPDDLRVIQALSNASIPVTILLSKADLLDDASRQQVQSYVRDHVFSELGREVPVYPVSIVPSHKDLLHAWVQEDLSNLYARQRELRRDSVSRKVAALKDGVRATLELQLNAVEPEGDHAALQDVERQLRRASGVLQEKTPELRRMTEEISGLGPSIVRKASDAAALGWAKELEIDLGEVLWITAARAMEELAGQLRSRLDHTIRSLRVEMLEVAAALRISDVPSPEELFADREMPVFHLNREPLSVSRPMVARLFGHGALRQHAGKKLRVLLPAIEVALNSYASLLRGWCELALNTIELRFNNHADRYRAQLDHLLNGRMTPESEMGSLRADIETLSAEMIITRA